MSDEKIKSGFVSLIGRPSSGKSTLINTICGFKISAVSRHPQTTQFIIKGIYNDKEAQIIFIDTPGYHNYDSNMNRGLSNLAVRSLDDADLILYLVDLTREFGKEEEDITGILKNINKDIIIIYNKIDIDKKDNNIKKTIESRLKAKNSIEVSAKTGENINNLVKIIKNILPYGPLYYPVEYVTDQSIPFRIMEVVREKVFINTKDEIPHSIYVEVISLKEKNEKLISNAIIYVEKESQKSVLIGKEGKMIKKIGEEARHELSKILEKKIDLFLRIKLHHKWRKKDVFLKKKFKFG